ncbi:MAG: LamG-like jellyroll fold domain-containing protein, partial [Gammaproteobacteria bacterium]
MKAGGAARGMQYLFKALLACAGTPAFAGDGLLFYLSANGGTTADVAAPGTAAPTFDAETSVIADGARGPGIQCNDLQKLAWRAPGNIYAQRGTLSFYWRARYPVGPTAFPLFRVAYADHSSWDMTWLRIDYNGHHGFDAFVTDASLSRTRVSVDVKDFPKPSDWTLVTFSWDETTGIKLYLDGKLVASKTAQARYDAALDQFGPHSRVISPYQVQSDYNFTRGGDIDEIRIYDHALPDAEVATLAKLPQGDALAAASGAPTRQEYAALLHRYGWDAKAPPYYPGRALAVRKVEIHDAYDLKRWWWKATDGIRETTWPGVYNRSRLPGRNDYFQLPDWDTYVDGGKAITFTLPDEPVNQIEFSGAAWGAMERLADKGAAQALFARPRGVEHSVHTLRTPVKGGKIRFTNAMQEQPIGELSAYHVTAGTEPAGRRTLAFELGGGTPPPALAGWIRGRFPAAEQAMLVARPQGAPAARIVPAPAGLPVVQVLIPNSWDALAATDGLDGIAIDLPALKVKAVRDGLVPLNIRVKDPLWPL